MSDAENVPTEILIEDETPDNRDEFLNIEQEQDLFPDTATNNSFGIYPLFLLSAPLNYATIF